ncbi:MAG: mRNA surveillance protein pelota [Ignisphaera sp.]
MRLEVLDYRDGVLSISIDSFDDLWILSMIISRGDIVRARTSRDVSIGDEKRRIPMILAVRVEKMEFQPFTNRLRIHGIVVEGPDRFGVKGSHHTISVGVGDEITVQKVFWDPRVLDEVMKIVRPLNVMLVAVDFDEYAIAVLQMQGMKILDSRNVSLPLSDEYFEAAEKELVSELAKKIIEAAHRYNVEAVVVASPGSLKNKVRDAIASLDSGIKVFLDTVANGGYAGLQELLNRDVVRNIIRDSSIEKASRILEEFDYLIAKDINRVAYGLSHVELAASIGAVEKLLVVDDMLAGFDENREKVEAILRNVVEKGGAVVIVPGRSPPGERVKMLGGIIAILRYSIDFEDIET